MDTIPDLDGKICEALVRQEYWHQGKKHSEVNIVFLKIKDGAWHRFFFDCRVLFWNEVDRPEVWQTTPTDLYHYPHIDMGTELSVVGQAIASVKLWQNNDSAEIHLCFENGILMLLCHSYTNDEMSIVLSHCGSS